MINKACGGSVNKILNEDGRISVQADHNYTNTNFSTRNFKNIIREDGIVDIQVDSNCLLFNGLETTQKVLLTHGDGVSEDTLAPNFKVIAKSGELVAGLCWILFIII